MWGEKNPNHIVRCLMALFVRHYSFDLLRDQSHLTKCGGLMLFKPVHEVFSKCEVGVRRSVEVMEKSLKLTAHFVLKEAFDCIQ